MVIMVCRHLELITSIFKKICIISICQSWVGHKLLENYGSTHLKALTMRVVSIYILQYIIHMLDNHV